MIYTMYNKHTYYRNKEALALVILNVLHYVLGRNLTGALSSENKLVGFFSFANCAQLPSNEIYCRKEEVSGDVIFCEE